jgi:hypothetical protein
MKQETPEKLIRRQCHLAFYVAVPAVSPVECDLSIGERNQAMVGTGHTMGVAAEILENVFRAAERPFAVDDPVVMEHLTDKGVKRLRIRKMLQLAMESDRALSESVLESLRELASEYATQRVSGQKKVVMQFCENPALMVERQSTRGNDAVHVRMMFHPLSPGVEHTEEADLGTQVFRVAGNLDQRFSAETQQQWVDEFLVLQCELCQKPRHRENDVSVGDRKKLFLSPLDPTPASVGLTFWAMPITTGVIGGDSIPATWTLIEMAAESSGPAALDRFQDLNMLSSDPLAAAFDERLPGGADNIGHLHGWPVHLWLPGHL